MYKKILLAYDGSETGQNALLQSREMADWGKSEVALVAVMPPPAAFIGGEGGVYDVGLEEEERKEFQSILDDGVRRLMESGRYATAKKRRQPTNSSAGCSRSRLMCWMNDAASQPSTMRWSNEEDKFIILRITT